MPKWSNYIRNLGTAGPATIQGIRALGFALISDFPIYLAKVLRVDQTQSFTSGEKLQGRSNLGLGTIATQASSAVDITGGTITGITDLAIADGGTGASTAATARTNLGLGNVDNTSDANKPVSTATQTALNLKAPLASPLLSGVPTAPTAAPGTNTTQLATTAFAAAIDATIKAPTRTILSGNTSVVAGTYSRPAGCTKILAQLQAAGGGGGYAKSTALNAAVGGGGGGGQYADKVIAAPAASYPYSLGANGKGGLQASNTAATAAGTSTFGSGPAILTCAGGAPGGSSAAASVLGGSVFGGDGGSGPSGGDVSVAGGRGGYGIIFSGAIAFSGAGGNSILGNGSQGAGDTSGPIAGSGYGPGGTGGSRTNGAVSDGADGGLSVLIIDEYYD